MKDLVYAWALYPLAAYQLATAALEAVLTTAATASSDRTASTTTPACPPNTEPVHGKNGQSLMTTYSLEFGKVGDMYPVPATAITVDDSDENALPRAVAAYAIPFLKPALEAAGHPEYADCLFRTTSDPSYGDFMWVDLLSGEGARFCATRITPTP
ncbi:hypothetical protein ACFYPC_36710 [Streptomyces sp. NPDC005808]|uniref:hypothetical protein n=1 Tax=Streptomyces sp. NPDC005808 TaxID=3364734 RepID=UPI00368BCCDA